VKRFHFISLTMMCIWCNFMEQNKCIFQYEFPFPHFVSCFFFVSCASTRSNEYNHNVYVAVIMKRCRENIFPFILLCSCSQQNCFDVFFTLCCVLKHRVRAFISKFIFISIHSHTHFSMLFCAFQFTWHLN
jgi:hypothetical protein